MSLQSAYDGRMYTPNMHALDLSDPGQRHDYCDTYMGLIGREHVLHKWSGVCRGGRFNISIAKFIRYV